MALSQEDLQKMVNGVLREMKRPGYMRKLARFLAQQMRTEGPGGVPHPPARGQL